MPDVTTWFAVFALVLEKLKSFPFGSWHTKNLDTSGWIALVSACMCDAALALIWRQWRDVPRMDPFALSGLGVWCTKLKRVLGPAILGVCLLIIASSSILDAA